MEPINTLESTVLPLLRNDIDTDQIIPASYLKVTDKAGLAKGLFANWRYLSDGAPNPEFVLNLEHHQGARILLAGENFGCGSSREHAPWALLQHGFRAVLSTRFADIFQANALGNGLLTITLPERVILKLVDAVAAEPSARVCIRLAAQTVDLPDGTVERFEVDSFSRHCLLHGVDALGYLLSHSEAISSWEAAHPRRVNTRHLGAKRRQPMAQEI